MLLLFIFFSFVVHCSLSVLEDEKRTIKIGSLYENGTARGSVGRLSGPSLINLMENNILPLQEDVASITAGFSEIIWVTKFSFGRKVNVYVTKADLQQFVMFDI